MNFLRVLRFPQLPSVPGKRFITHSADSDVFNVRAKESLTFYMKLLNINAHRTRELLSENPSLCHKSVNFNDVKATANCFKEYKFTNQEILARPTTLLINRITALNRLTVLEECSFRELKLAFLDKFIVVIRKDISHLKAFNYIDRNANVPQNIANILDVPVTLDTNLSDKCSLSEVRKVIINAYLKKKLGMKNEDITKVWNVYGRIKHKSIGSLVDVINLLLNDLKFSKSRINKNMFLLYACADNISQIIAGVPHIDGTPMEEIIHSRPKIAMQNAESVKAIVKHIRSFNIPDSSISKCLEVLTLGPETVYERLAELRKVKEFEVLCSNPRIIRLIHYQTKAKTRLDYLKDLKVKCVSLHVLTSSSDGFEKYARDGVGRTKGRDAIHYLAKVFDMDTEDVRSVLSRHPNWCHVPIINIKNSLDYLRYKQFSIREIGDNLILILYPASRIEQKLSALLEWKAENDENRMISGVALSAISNSKLLNLCLYFIESEFHFSGDGIWEPATPSNNKQDIFPTTIPEFPKSLLKDYRYGLQKKNKEALS